ncbi:riboflavin deaminase [Stappia sp. GBMRC 2046]|uniref:Riboflavin deaminase n=2 Tax=Stappia sediminis TaxID=2692190 RepID=A0A7X3LX01_9HYPH|nr:riboflavin deaminase [Stappia sediminis]
MEGSFPASSSSREIADDGWSDVLAAFENGGGELPDQWQALFQPLLNVSARPLMVGQLGQSLDGRIATVTGHSKYINGDSCLAHLHRLRAVCDAVVVGVGTALYDRPRLTVRRVAGRNPARIVIDPRGRLHDWSSLCTGDARCILITGPDARPEVPDNVEVFRLSLAGEGFDPEAIRALLAEQGFRRVLIEGGGATISRFLTNGSLDRLHLLIAPIIIGAGPTGLQLPPIETIDEAVRPRTTIHRLGEEVLIDCDFSGCRPIGGSA